MTDYVETARFNDCRSNDLEAHKALWEAVGKVTDKVNEVCQKVERSRGAVLMLQALITFLMSAGGVALMGWLQKGG